MTKPFQPLLAATCDDISKLRYPVLASPKLDGIRCVKLGGRALTRKLKPVPNDFVRTWIEANLPDGIDGEIMLGDRTASFSAVSSAVMKKSGVPNFVFCAFDVLVEGVDAESLAFEDRFQELLELQALKPNWVDHFLVVPHVLAETPEELQEIVDSHVDLGYEGTMVRDPNGRYKFGRSTVNEGILLKIKSFVDEEATVVGAVEQMHNTNEATLDERGYTKRSSAKEGKVGTGKLGALVCLTEDGVEFEIGTGFTDVQRRDLWEEIRTAKRDGFNEGEVFQDRLVKFKHLGRFPDTKAPRAPVFLGWRED